MTERTITFSVDERTLHFRQPAGTSRGVYTERRIWLVTATDGAAKGVGECAPLPQLSCDDTPNYGDVLQAKCSQLAAAIAEGEAALSAFFDDMRPYPSMLFGLETALRALSSQSDILFDTPFSRGEVGIPINGLVWMGSYEQMEQRIEQKLAAGYGCVKLKIGALDFDSELELIKKIRSRYSHHDVELRVDANGAFAFDDALYRLELLSQYALHSIEQPIRAGQWSFMAELCRESPLPIALDEELIGINDPDQKRQMLNIIRPAYVVLKPSLHGGMAGTREWVDIARDMGIGSWITSALESNIGLNAIAQLCADIYGPDIRMAQGLGTGQLFTDNIPMPLAIHGDRLWRERIGDE
ncbi:MAG: o-succinylbenzoate synthase [Prevotella sp.]|nr:o-succinylbenzoate synthase [Prevotella sp.]